MIAASAIVASRASATESRATARVRPYYARVKRLVRPMYGRGDPWLSSSGGEVISPGNLSVVAAA